MPRISRTAETRDASTRRAEERAPPQMHYQSRLYVPQNRIPDGYEYAWVAESVLNEPTPDNMTDRMINGWEPVPAARHPEMVPPPLPGYEGTEAQVIRRGGLMLCQKRKELVEQARIDRDLDNLEALQDVAWTGQADPNLPRFEDNDSGVSISRQASFKE
jgi:hypothetical protein